jgi:hypothetical protein
LSTPLLRLDGDLYNSTLVCLENLYPRVVSGGAVVVDDFDLVGSRNAVLDYFTHNVTLDKSRFEFKPVNGINFKDGAYWIRP